MDINKINNHASNPIQSSKAEEAERTSKPAAADKSRELSDKVSISTSSANKSEELFAKIELEKLNQSSFEKLKMMNAKIKEYEAAKNAPGDLANKTEIGKKLNDLAIWEKIAKGILDS